ncbi:nitrate reductase [Shewanella sp. Scap07]|uniref:nitrate reductase n=1 Tax=Shewanella sp. Scap07 TaxID=2589987 RepID=UPI0015C1548F|nr:nitrate reductase [Shewanella sp. Scap07]QLE87593.1 nitrate reductase [Shewanella sp. Scap07]
MSQNPSSPWIKSTCAYCGVGCGIEAKPQRDGTLSVRGDNDHPANWGKLCSKGMALGETVTTTGRLLQPHIAGSQCDWSQAIATVANQFTKTIAEHGPDSVAFYLSGQLLTEDYYVANKLMKGFIGSGNVDTNSRLCMSSSVAGHKRAFGNDSVPGCYQDLESADAIVLVGSNLAWCHPILFQRIKQAKQQHPNKKLIVIDPRATASSADADLHLAIKPGSDVLLFNGLFKYLHDHGHTDSDYINQHTQGFAANLASVADLDDLQALSQQLQISQADLLTFYQTFANTDKVTTLYSQGVNQSSQGTDKVNSIINCHLVTAKIGRSGANPFSITGQPNAMGGREVGGLANTLAAHLEFNNDKHQQLVSEFWQTDNLATRPGLKAVEMFDAIAKGKIKAVWIMATNPAVSLPDSDFIQQALAQCPFVVVSDCIANTDTGKLADVQLPAQGWSEKSGTVTNSERRISRQRRLTVSPGEARPDWWIITEVAKKMGFAQAFSYRHEADIFREYAALTAAAHRAFNTDLNLSGLAEINDHQYSNMPPQQWPVTHLQTEVSHQHLLSDGQFYTANGKANIIPVRYIPSPQAVTKRYPLLLNNGRIRDQWHTMTRTGLSVTLSSHQAEPLLLINPADAASYHLTEGMIAQINSHQSQRAVMMRVSLSNQVSPGQVFAPIHWNNSNSAAAKIATLGQSITDPVSGQPEMKHTPVAITPFVSRSQAILISRQPLLFANLPDSPEYWIQQTIAGGYRYMMASSVDVAALCENLRQLQPQSSSAQQSMQQSEQQVRFIMTDQQRIEFAFTCATDLDVSQYDWFSLLLTQTSTAPEKLQQSLSSVLSDQPQGELCHGKIVCACKQVGINQIHDAIADQQLSDVAGISRCTQAGTGCGSCVSELQQILAEQHSKVSAY